MLLNQSGDIAFLTLEGPSTSAGGPEHGEGRQAASSPPRGDASLGRPGVIVQTPFTEDNAEISPDGRWLAYQSNESGEPQIYVRPFPKVDAGRWPVSTNGGVKPVWARNGRELFYVAPNNALMAVPVAATAIFTAGNPTKLFDAPYFFTAPNRTYDVSPDGQRFLMIKDSTTTDQTSTPASLIVVLNWLEELSGLCRRSRADLVIVSVL